MRAAGCRMEPVKQELSGPLRIVPANEATWADIEAVFGGRGPGYRCQCQRYKLAPGEAFARFAVEERAARLREQTGVDEPPATGPDDPVPTSGLVAYDGDTPVGWCAVEPRTAYRGLVRNARVPWEGRDEDRADGSVWAITCLFARAGHRRRGVSRALAAAAVAHARERGARAVEAYPIVTRNVIDEEVHVGTPETFAAAGLREVSRPTPRRMVMRLELTDAGR